MKIVCDACQAKYSIADEKIQGKAFKIRCKKCNHIIVVRVGADGVAASSTSSAAGAEKPRNTGSQAASSAGARASGSQAVVSSAAARSPSPATAAVAEQPVWHIVVDGEQVGPLTESEIKDRLRQGKVNSDTLVWKEGFGDWTAFSAVPELTPLLARITHHPTATKSAGREPGRATSSQKAVAAPEAAAEDPFAAPTVITPAGTADLFASAMAAAPAATAAPAPSPAPTSPFLFGGGAPAQPAEPQVMVRSTGGNGAGTTHLTGQRNENSVLFSLSNLEALAVPSQQSGGIRSPSSSTNTEGSGLIDIRSMAAMTLNDGAPGALSRSSDGLPTFSTPQFSPVAPVLLPLSSSGPPKWVFPVGALLAVGILVVGFMIFKIGTAPPPGLAPVPPPPPPAPVVAPPVAAAPAAPVAEPTKPAATGEKPAAEEKPGEKTKASGRGEKGKRRGGDQSARGSTDGKKGSESTASGSSPGESPGSGKAPGRKGAKSLDDLLGEVGSKKTGGDDGAPKAAPVKLVTLTQSDIVSAMKAVQPKVQACANQFKVPGTAMANLSVASGGRVSNATVTGKFAGTPSGSCVESAAKSAKFPPCQAMNFPWPFTLSPR